ncbi:MAG TPA: MFS transporter [Armatimonadota bacterium]|nr:MFS transporter [Armatimonadota bacterium]
MGIFLAIQTGGMIVGNALLGHLADRRGNRLLLRALALLHALVPLCAVLAGLIAGEAAPAWRVYLLFAPTFFGYGALLGSTWMGVTNYLLEIAPEHDRPAYIAVTNALNLPAIVLPMVGGLALTAVGYTPIFLLAAAVLLGAFFLTRALPEPRAGGRAGEEETAPA